MCRCAERRTRIVEAAHAVATGDLGAGAQAVAFVATTAAADLAQATRLAAAKMRLRR